MSEVLIIADDLTGACDAAAPFASHGLRVEVALDGRDRSESDVLAASTDSRDLPEVEALAHLNSFVKLKRAEIFPILFKKIDSVLRGNTFAEVAAMVSLFPDRISLFSPSFPAVGRKVHKGRLSLENDRDFHLDISSMLSSRGIPHALLSDTADAEEKRAAFHAAIADSRRLVLCSAETQSELDWLALASLSFGRQVLWIGSGGLARALANALTVTNISPGPDIPCVETIFFCVGSVHPSTVEQVEHLCHTNLATRIRNSISRPAATALNKRTSLHPLLEIGPDDLSPDTIFSFLQQLRISPSTALFLSGGDTASRICNVLGVRSISLRGEILPGVPWGILRGGIAEGIPVITKSGGFGSSDTLTRIARLCSRVQAS